MNTTKAMAQEHLDVIVISSESEMISSDTESIDSQMEALFAGPIPRSPNWWPPIPESPNWCSPIPSDSDSDSDSDVEWLGHSRPAVDANTESENVQVHASDVECLDDSVHLCPVTGLFYLGSDVEDQSVYAQEDEEDSSNVSSVSDTIILFSPSEDSGVDNDNNGTIDVDALSTTTDINSDSGI